MFFIATLKVLFFSIIIIIEIKIDISLTTLIYPFHSTSKSKDNTMSKKTLPIITQRKIRLGLVGCGRIAKNHFDAIANFPDALELVAICDTNQELLESTQKLYKVKAFTDYNKMLLEDLDLVILCTPSGFHAKESILAARHKINIITEKPMATNLADAKEMIEVCEQENVRLFIIKQNRFNKTL